MTQRENQGAYMSDVVLLNGRSLTQTQVVMIAFQHTQVQLCEEALDRVKVARVCVEEVVERGEIVYGVNTGFGSNADIVLRDKRAAERLQKNLILTHAVCVGAPLPSALVRAMMAIRINTLLGGHSGLRVSLLHRLTEMLNHDLLPIIPERGSVGASGDLAPLSHMALPLLGEGDVIYRGERTSAKEALGFLPSNLDRPTEEHIIHLSYKEGLALNNGTTLMAASATLALHRISQLLQLADMSAAMSIEAICGRSAAFRQDVHTLRPHPGQIRTARNLRALLKGSTFVDIPFEAIPSHFGRWKMEQLGDGSVKFRGGKPPRPQDSYSIRCVPQVHGAVRDAFDQVERVLQIELNSVTDNPLIFPQEDGEQRFASAGHFHGMPIALALSYLKVAIVPLASISERRLNKLVDAATSDGLPAFLVKNLDGSESGYMIVQYTAASLVNELASRATPATVYSIPTSANTEDHVSMGATEARHVLSMIDDLARVIALELMTAAQAIDVRREILEGSYWNEINEETEADPSELITHREEMQSRSFRPSAITQKLHSTIREKIQFMREDRGLFRDVQVITQLVIENPEYLIQAAQSVLSSEEKVIT